MQKETAFNIVKLFFVLSGIAYFGGILVIFISWIETSLIITVILLFATFIMWIFSLTSFVCFLEKYFADKTWVKA